MFESDQHEFDEGYDELGHVAPPPPLAKPVPEPIAPAATSDQTAADELRAMLKAQTSPVVSPSPALVPAASAAPAAAVAASVAVAEPDEEEEEEDEYDYEKQQEPEEFTDPAEHALEEPLPPVLPKKGIPIWMMGGFAALIGFAILIVYTATKPKDNAPPPGDMGPGVVQAAGLRGHLTTRWDGDRKTGRLVYQLHVESMEDRWQPGFSKAILSPPQPLSVNVRLLDATGFALCGKEIPFHFDAQNAQVQVAMPAVGQNGKKLSAVERTAAYQAARQSALAQMQATQAAREQGKDVFQNQIGPDSTVTAVNVQGSLPCSPDQYQKASYWDMNTNFPTLDEQAALLDPRAAALKAKQAEGAHAKKPSNKPQTGFVFQGDERVTEYDAARGQLWTQGRTFRIDRMVGQATAMAWANNNTLIHYRCDQQANCALTAPGGSAVLHAHVN